MRVKCVICEKVERIDDESIVAKRLRNRPIHTYLCEICNTRISDKTKARIATGKFRFYQDNNHHEDW